MLILQPIMNKKIMVIIGSLDVGGAERHLLVVLPELVKKGWKITVSVLGHKGVLAPLFEAQDVLVRPILGPRLMKFTQILPRFIRRLLQALFVVPFLRARLKKEKPTILHFFLPEAYILGMFSALCARFSGCTIMSRRSMNHYQKRRVGVGFCEKKLYAKTKLISGNSQAVLSQLHSEGILPAKTRLIYNGVDFTSFQRAALRSETRKDLNIPDNTWVIIMVANLISYKGHQDLLQALSDISSQLSSPWTLLCVGRDDGIQEALQKKAQTLKIEHNIVWLGSRSDIPDLLMASDVGVLCSHEEGFSNAILEGMAAGLPMVVTDVGGNKEAVIDQETGFVVQPRNPKALGDAILKLFLNPKQAEQFGKMAKERAMTQFSLEACVNQYVALYDEALRCVG
jgi:glycosyltransferase involved in cell wall biosynthesis